MYTLQGKPYQHATHIPHSVHVWSQTKCISRDQHIATFREVINSGGQSHCSWEKGLPTQSTARRLIDPWVHTQFLSWASHWSSGAKATICWRQVTRLIRPMSPTCDRYIEYLLTGANPSVLNRHMRGLQPWRCWLSTYLSKAVPTSGLHFPPKGPVRSIV
jgi:hypothetical protein